MQFRNVGFASVVTLAAMPAFANDTLVEIDASLSQEWREGSAVNSSGFGDELEEFALGKVSARVAHGFGSGVVIQGTLHHDESFADTWTTAAVPGLFESDETYRRGQQLTLQLGQHSDQFYFGGYAAVGQVSFKSVDADQDTAFNSAGVQLGWYEDAWGVAMTVGSLQSSAVNPESIDNATLFGLSGAYYFNDSTRLGLSVSKFSGEQDTDSSGGADPVDIYMAGLELEHEIVDRSSYKLAVYGGVDWMDVQEQSSSSDIDRARDTIVSFGVRIRFGAQSGAALDRQRTPALPEMLRAIGGVPIVD